MRIANMQPPRVMVLLAAFAAVPSFCFGQGGYHQMPPQPYCDELPAPGPPSCGCEHSCHRCAKPTCDQPQPRSAPRPRPAPPPQATLQETGYYQAGPRTGALEGASRTFGLRGGAFELPRLRLELPSIELPSFYHASHGARMRVRESFAPWVSTGYRQLTTGGAAPQSRAADTPPSEDEEPRPRAKEDEESDKLKAKYQEKIEELNRKLRQCDEMRQVLERSLCDSPALMQRGGPQCPPPHGMPPQMPPAVHAMPQGIQQVPPGPACLPPNGQTLPHNEVQPLPPGVHPQQGFPLPAPNRVVPPQPQAPPGGNAPPRPAPMPPAGPQESASLGGPGTNAFVGAAAARLSQPVAASNAFAPTPPQPLPQVVHRSRLAPSAAQFPRDVMPVSHLAAPRPGEQPQLEPLPTERY